MNSTSPANVWLRPIGSPVPLGFVGLAVASLVTTGFAFGWVPVSHQTHVGTIILAFAFPLQFIASILCFLARDGAAGTALGTQAATWLALGISYVTSAAGTTSAATGLLLVGAGGALLLVATAVAMSKLVPALVVGLTGLRFIADGIYEISRTEGWQDLGGALGLAIVAAAGYAVLALVLEDAEGRTVLPLGRVRRGVAALEGPLREQVDPAVNEPGVREIL